MSANAAVTPSDRLSFTLFVAAVLHALIVFGVVFAAPKMHMPKVMEVTLAQHRSKSADKNADFLANANQQGSGVLEKAALVTSPQQSRFHDERINDVMLQEQQKSVTPVTAVNRAVITTRGHSDRVAHKAREGEVPRDQVLPQEAQLAMAWQSDEIASLEARLAAKKQAYAKRPRIRAVSTISTRFDRDAAYVDAFRARVEEVGNRNYPRMARERKIFGNVRLMVSILANGDVKEIVLLKSSGYSLLDEAAKQSVRLAAPFPPFPAEIRRDTDILQIIRTWKFSDRLTADNG